MDLSNLAPGTLGFKIEAFLQLQHWKPLAIDGCIPMTVVTACPADGSSLGTLCTLVDSAGERRVRVGCCPECGHVMYIDRPTKAWMDE